MATARRKQLMAACALRGDRGLGQVCRLLHEASARDLEYVGEEGYGLLDIAALYGSPRVCEALLKKGVPMDAPITAAGNKRLGCTPLFAACDECHLDVVTVLLKAGADVNKVAADGATPLLHACASSAPDGSTPAGPVLEVVQLLLERGAVAHAADRMGLTPLHEACRNGYTQVAELLLAHGADVNCVSSMPQSHTPLHVCCNMGRRETAAMLISKGADLERLSDKGTPLLEACICGQTEAVELLLARGACIDVTDKEGLMPLSMSVAVGRYKLAKLLLSNGACPNQGTWCGGAFVGPLHQACCKGSTQMVKLLLSYGADIDLDDGGGRTPLCYACYREHEEVVALLLDRGADADKSRGSGCLTPQLEAKARALIEQRKAIAADAAAVTSALRGASNDGVGRAASAAAGGSAAGSAGAVVASAAVVGPDTTTACADAARMGAAAASSCPADDAATYLADIAQPPKQCAHCGLPKSAAAKLFKCSGCQAVRYCSAACQALHWREGGHKRECKALRAQRQHADEGDVSGTGV